MSVFHRLEIDVMQANELVESVELALKYQMPAMVVHPGLSSDALRARGRVNGRFKIITPVDWPKGENFGIMKFRGLSLDAIETDGFEIMLTGNKDEGSTKGEVKALTEFVKKRLSEITEVRFVLGAFMRDEDNIDSLIRGLVGARTPAYVRIDSQLKLQVSKANTEVHNALVKRITDVVRVPVKVSGNITGVRTVTGVPDARRFAVSLLQAKAIIKEFIQQPDGLKNLLDDPAKGEESSDLSDV